MKKYYVNGQELILDPKVFASGEEGRLYLCRNLSNKVMLAKIFKEYRRKNLLVPNEDMYKKQTELETKSFYLPKNLIYDIEEKFSGCVVDLFKNGNSFTLAQCTKIKDLVLELNKIYDDIDLLSENNIKIHDMKIDHILYNYKKNKLGVVDTGLFMFSDDKDLKKQNYILMNYVLRNGLLWVNKECTQIEMWSTDLPEIYDTLDHDIVSLADILLDESNNYNVETVEELKKVYKKNMYY
jgi:hypothetical protein